MAISKAIAVRVCFAWKERGFWGPLYIGKKRKKKKGIHSWHAISNSNNLIKQTPCHLGSQTTHSDMPARANVRSENFEKTFFLIFTRFGIPLRNINLFAKKKKKKKKKKEKSKKNKSINLFLKRFEIEPEKWKKIGRGPVMIEEITWHMQEERREREREISDSCFKISHILLETQGARQARVTFGLFFFFFFWSSKCPKRQSFLFLPCPDLAAAKPKLEE